MLVAYEIPKDGGRGYDDNLLEQVCCTPRGVVVHECGAMME
jgi:hypothetical protein